MKTFTQFLLEKRTAGEFFRDIIPKLYAKVLRITHMPRFGSMGLSVALYRDKALTDFVQNAKVRSNYKKITIDDKTYDLEILDYG